MAANVFDDATTRDLLALVRLYRRNGWPNVLRGGQVQPPSELPIFFHNGSGEEIPAYACMQITGTEEIGGQNYVVVEKPADSDGSAGAFIFNGHYAVADNEEGVAQPGPVVRAFKNTGTVTGGDRWQPVASQWYLEQDDSGMFIACGADDIDDDVLKVVVGSTTTENNIAFAVTPGGGIGAISGTTVSFATCTVYKVVGTTWTATSDTISVGNLSSTAVANSVKIGAARDRYGTWIAFWEDC